MDLKDYIRDIPDFPEPGILFRDITTLLREPKAFQYVLEKLVEEYKDQQINYVAGIESRGFIFGTPLALQLGCGFVPIRKPGKLPAAVFSESYTLEYGKNTLEIHQDAFGNKGSRVLIIDDLLATGGTAVAAGKLVQKAGGTLAGFGFIIELTFLNGRAKLLENVPAVALVSY